MVRVMENEIVIDKDKIYVEKPRFMLVSKILLILTVVVLYVMQMVIGIPILGLYLHKNFGNLNFKLIFILLGVSLVLDLATFILSIIGSVKNEAPLTKISVVIKIVMIPFFCINLVLWLLLISGMLNPFLLFGIPFVGFVGICLTYAYMLMTGLPDVIYSIIVFIRNKKRPKLLVVLGDILCFFFLADVIGIFLIHGTFKKTLIEN